MKWLRNEKGVIDPVTLTMLALVFYGALFFMFKKIILEDEKHTRIEYKVPASINYAQVQADIKSCNGVVDKEGCFKEKGYVKIL